MVRVGVMVGSVPNAAAARGPSWLECRSRAVRLGLASHSPDAAASPTPHLVRVRARARARVILHHDARGGCNSSCIGWGVIA